MYMNVKSIKFNITNSTIKITKSLIYLHYIFLNITYFHIQLLLAKLLAQIMC